MNPTPTAAQAAPRSFAAMRHPGYRMHFTTYVLAMMADNIEHVISYWMMFQKFQSPALGGFAVVSHWLPFLVFSVPVGALADRADPRRIIQAGMLLFITASLGWAYFFITDTLQMWQAMVLLVVHGCAGVLWQTASQLILHDIVPTEQLQSAVRMNATARYLGVLVGPAVGCVLLLQLGAAHGMLVNTLFYLPLLLWLWKAPYGPKFRHGKPPPKRAVRGFADITATIRDIASLPIIVSMVLLAGAASFFIGGAYQAQMPNFAHDLGHGDAGVAYSMLLAADAAGALIAGFILESTGWLKPSSRTALLLAIIWCVALASFALASSYALALGLLFVAGFFELSFSSMAQTMVQMNAPAEMRGRVIGLFNMSALGLRTFSGVTVGLAGAVVGVHASLAGSALLLLAVVTWLLYRGRRLALRQA
ncbi:MFS transporter [soil metagenome]